MRRIGTAVALVVAAAIALVAWILVTTSTDATAGRGWQLLTAAPHSAPAAFGQDQDVRAGLLASEADMNALWSELGPSDDLPTVDFARTVVLWAVGVGSGSCPNHLDGVAIGDQVVVTATHGFVTSCSADAVPYTFVIGIDRDALPSAPFSVRVVTDSFDTSVRVERLP